MGIEQVETPRVSFEQEIKTLQAQFNNLGKAVIELFDNRLTNEFDLKIKIKEWAYSLEQIMLKHGQPEQTREICTYLVNYLHKKGLREDRVDQMVYDSLEEFPHYKNETIYQKTGRSSSDLPVENTIYFNQLQKGLNVLDALQWARLTNSQQRVILERMTEIRDDKADEGKKYYGIELETESYSQLDENEKSNPYQRKITAEYPELSHLTEACKKQVLRAVKAFEQHAIIFEAIKQEFIKAPPQIEESAKEIADAIESDNELYYPFADKKWKRGTVDWGAIAVIADEYNMNAAAGENRAETTYCKHCREPDEYNDPSGTQGLMKPVSMIPVYNYNRGIVDRTTGRIDNRIYIWVCKRCKGTDRVTKELTKERVTDNIRDTMDRLHQFINKGGFPRALHEWWTEWRRPYRTNDSYRISPKLERKR